MRMRVSVVLLTMASSAFGQPYFQPPTATELFELRSRCAALVDKMYEELAVGSALTKSQTSHYDPRTNHCYAEINVMSNDPKVRYANRTLFDAQTGDVIAFAKIEKNKQVGMVFGRASDMRGDLGFSDASEYIDRLMKEDR